MRKFDRIPNEKRSYPRPGSIEEFAAIAEPHLQQLGYDNVDVRVGDGSRGWPEQAPFGVVLLTAACSVSFTQAGFVLLGFGLGVVAQGVAICATTVLQIEIDDGTLLAGDAMVLATGASPRRLPGTEELGPHDGLFTLRTLDDSLALRAALTARESCRVVVIGAGFIRTTVSTCAPAPEWLGFNGPKAHTVVWWWRCRDVPASRPTSSSWASGCCRRSAGWMPPD